MKNDKRTILRGTADDFYELSFFCEAFLGDYYLSALFLKRYLEQYPDSAHILTPTYIQKLLRIGDLGSVNVLSRRLRHRLYGNTIYNQIRIFFKLDHPMSERYEWEALNALILSDTALSEPKRISKYRKQLQENRYCILFPREQILYDIEVLIQNGEFDKARELINGVDTYEASPSELNELSFFYSKMGQYDDATSCKEMMIEKTKDYFGDESKRKYSKKQVISKEANTVMPTNIRNVGNSTTTKNEMENPDISQGANNMKDLNVDSSDKLKGRNK